MTLSVLRPLNLPTSLNPEMENAMIAELAKGKWRTARDA
jgi:hypothetical protein